MTIREIIAKSERMREELKEFERALMSVCDDATSRVEKDERAPVKMLYARFKELSGEYEEWLDTEVPVNS